MQNPAISRVMPRSPSASPRARAQPANLFPGGCVVPPTELARDAATAVPVSSVEQEYAWLTQRLRPGWKREVQSLVRDGARWFDVLRVRHADGTVRDYWFDVSAPFRAASGLDLELGEGRLRVQTTPPCTLPSAISACDIARGDWSSLPRVIGHTVGRAVLIALGILAAGERDPAKLIRYGLGSAVAIEVFAIIWASAHTE